MPTTFNTMFQSSEDIILFILALAVLIVFLGCIYAFFRAIFLFIFSKGEDAKVKAARNSIRYMIIGLFLTIMLLFLGPQLLKLFRLQNHEVYTARNVFVKMGNIITGVGQILGIVIRDYPTNSGFGDTSSTLSDTSLGNLPSQNYEL
ncbi:MAG: hypothetical protein LBG59_05890 [Candidatus Peribacteria bacterium]|nr:hypothetical protein [Candidatus Peribacteria bacterium]